MGLRWPGLDCEGHSDGLLDRYSGAGLSSSSAAESRHDERLRRHASESAIGALIEPTTRADRSLFASVILAVDEDRG